MRATFRELSVHQAEIKRGRGKRGEGRSTRRENSRRIPRYGGMLKKESKIITIKPFK